MTMEPIGAVRPDPAASGDSHSAAWEPELTVVAPRRPVEHEDGVHTEGDRAAATPTLVSALLQLSGLTPAQAETAAMASRFVGARAAVRALYCVPEARYEDPGLVFRAAP